MASWPPRKNAAFVFYVGLISQANTKIAQVNPTLAAGDVKVAVDDAAPANLTTLPVVDADFTKRVKVAMSAAEMNGDRITIIFADAAGAEWCDLVIDLPTSVRQIDDLAFPNISGRGIDVDATGGVEITANQAVTVATGGIGAGAHAAAELNAIADSVLDRNMATGTDSGTDSTAVRTPRQALRSLRNKNAIAAGVQTVSKEDDVTASWTAAVVTTAGNPISSVDPT